MKFNIKNPQKKKHLKPGAQFGLWLAGIALLGGLSILLLRNRTHINMSDGLTYLNTQETLDFDTVYEKVVEASKKLDPTVVENPDTLFSAFSNSVIMGDSRAAGFKEFGFLPASHVLAEVSAPISASQNYIDTIASMRPSYIFMTYGLNNIDPALEFGFTQQTIDNYEQDILNIQEASPDSTIVLCGLLPVTKAAIQSNPVYKNIDDFNAALKEIADKNGWLYDSGDSLNLKEDTYWYSQDGEHFDSEFYPLWARNMLETVLVNQSADIDSGAPESSSDPAGETENSTEEQSASAEQETGEDSSASDEEAAASESSDEEPVESDPEQ